MTKSLSITRQFFEGCSSKDYTERRLLLMNDMPEFPSRFVYSNSGGLLEIVLFKKTFKEIFSECHPVLEDFLAHGQVISHEDSLLKVYLMTTGILLTTNENHSVVSIHTDIVTKILSCSPTSKLSADPILDPATFLIRELYFLQTLLSSNIAKINKSSSLWHLLKRLFIFCQDTSSFDKLPSYFFFKAALAAAKLHPSNYYAWNFITFTTNVSKLTASCTFFLHATKEVELFCKANLNDASAWGCYTNIIEMNAMALKLTCEEYNKYAATRSPLEFVYQKVAVTIPGPREKLMDLSKWLWQSKCVAEVPYHAFGRLLLYTVKVWQDRLLVRQIMEQVVVHCSVIEQVWFRQKGLEVVVKNGYFTANVDLDKDAILKEKIQTYANWKRLLNWHTEFIFDRYLRDTVDVKIM